MTKDQGATEFESASEMLSRLQLIANGDRDCDLSENDEAALAFALDSHQGLLEALRLAQYWLANSVPIVDLGGPLPLPVIEAALAKAEGRK